MYYVIEASQVQKQGGIPTTSNNYPLDKNGYAIPILFDAINFGSNKAIPADSPTASPEDVMNNVLSTFCSNSSDITISQQECTNNTNSPEKAISVPALAPVSCAPAQQAAVSIPENQPAPTETAVCPPVIERPKAANAATSLPQLEKSASTKSTFTGMRTAGITYCRPVSCAA